MFQAKSVVVTTPSGPRRVIANVPPSALFQTEYALSARSVVLVKEWTLVKRLATDCIAVWLKTVFSCGTRFCTAGFAAILCSKLLARRITPGVAGSTTAQ